MWYSVRGTGGRGHKAKDTGFDTQGYWYMYGKIGLGYRFRGTRLETQGLTQRVWGRRLGVDG